MSPHDIRNMFHSVARSCISHCGKDLSLSPSWDRASARAFWVECLMPWDLVCTALATMMEWVSQVWHDLRWYRTQCAWPSWYPEIITAYACLLATFEHLNSSSSLHACSQRSKSNCTIFNETKLKGMQVLRYESLSLLLAHKQAALADGMADPNDSWNKIFDANAPGTLSSGPPAVEGPNPFAGGMLHHEFSSIVI